MNEAVLHTQGVSGMNSKTGPQLSCFALIKLNDDNKEKIKVPLTYEHNIFMSFLKFSSVF